MSAVLRDPLFALGVGAFVLLYGLLMFAWARYGA